MPIYFFDGKKQVTENKDNGGQKDLNSFSQLMTKVAVETTLNVELDEHLGYEKHQESSHSNSRNGFTSKTLKTEEGQFEIDIPRDRESSFTSQFVKKHQSRLTSMDDKIHYLYAKGMTPERLLLLLKKCTVWMCLARLFPK